MKRTAALTAVLAACTIAMLCGCTSAPSSATRQNPAKAADDNMRLGVAYMQQGNLKGAKEKLERAEQWDPRNADVHNALGVLFQRLDKPAQAESHFATAVRLAPGNAEFSNNYAQFLCGIGKTEAALKRFEAAATDKLYSTPWAALTNAGVCLVSVKRFDEAQRRFEGALQFRPNNSEAALQLAQLHLDQGRAVEAGKVVEQQLTMGRGTAELLLVGWRAARTQRNTAQTEDYARRLRRDFPNSRQARTLTQLSQNP